MSCNGPINRLRMLRTRGLFGPLAQRVGRTLCLWSPGYAHGAGGALSGPQPWPGPDPYLCCDYSQATIAPGPSSTYTGSPVFARASTATVWDYQGNLVTVPADVPRFQGARWDGAAWHNTDATGKPLSGIAYLCEPAATNLTLNSLLTTGWVPEIGATLSPSTEIAPNGTKTAALLSYPTVNSKVSAPGLSVIGQTVCVSFFVKSDLTAPTTTATLIGLGLAPTGVGAIFDLTTGVATKGTSSWTSVGMEDKGNGWWRIWGVGTPTSNSFLAPEPSGNIGNLLAWGAQVEVGNFPTSYIPTTGAAATRAADQLKYPTGTALSDIVLAIDYTPNADAASFAGYAPRLFGSDGTGGELRTVNNTPESIGSQAPGGWSLNWQRYVKGRRDKLAVSSIKNGAEVDYKASYNGQQVLINTITQSLNHSNTALEVGHWSAQPTQNYAGLIHSYRVFTQELTDAQLGDLTSKDFSCAAQASPIVNPPPAPPPAPLGPFTAVDAQYWLDPGSDEVLFDLFPPTGEPDLRIAYADLPDALADYGEYLAIIQAKIAEVEGV